MSAHALLPAPPPSSEPPPKPRFPSPTALPCLRHPRTTQPVHDHQLASELGALLLAGHEPLGHALAWCLGQLADNGACQVGGGGGFRSWGHSCQASPPPPPNLFLSPSLPRTS